MLSDLNSEVEAVININDSNSISTTLWAGKNITGGYLKPAYELQPIFLKMH
jgi:hypothetical protein